MGFQSNCGLVITVLDDISCIIDFRYPKGLPRELAWWMDLKHLVHGLPFGLLGADAALSSDASLLSWGVYYEGSSISVVI